VQYHLTKVFFVTALRDYWQVARITFVQAILDSPSTVQQSRYAYSAPVRIIGLLAMILGVLIAAGIAGAVMLVKLPVTLITGR
jgi:hypothetical protein